MATLLTALFFILSALPLKAHTFTATYDIVTTMNNTPELKSKGFFYLKNKKMITFSMPLYLS